MGVDQGSGIGDLNDLRLGPGGQLEVDGLRLRDGQGKGLRNGLEAVMARVNLIGAARNGWKAKAAVAGGADFLYVSGLGICQPDCCSGDNGACGVFYCSGDGAAIALRQGRGAPGESQYQD